MASKVSRGKDNYKNAYQYIKDQLFHFGTDFVSDYNYSNSEDLHIIKLKLWALDSALTAEEISDGIVDNNINNPLDHSSSLDNEIAFLDCYRKTKDGLLEENEQTFSELVESRIRGLETWTSFIDPETGEPRKDYEMPYSSRPTLLTEDQFEDLYKAYKIKERKGELSNCFDITQIVERTWTSKNIQLPETFPKNLYSSNLSRSDRFSMKQNPSTIGTDIGTQELAVNNYYPGMSESQARQEQKTEMSIQGNNEKKAKDDDIVYEMQAAHKEISEKLIEFKPAPFKGEDSKETTETATETTTTTITYSNSKVLGMNFPANRMYVTENEGTHKGFINHYDNTGGYRFVIYEDDLSTTHTLDLGKEGTESNSSSSDDSSSVKETVTRKIVNEFTNSNLSGQVEWDYKDFEWALRYTKTVTTTTTQLSSDIDNHADDNNPSTEPSTTKDTTITEYLVHSLPRKDFGEKWANVCGNPEQEKTDEEIITTGKRISELVERWIPFNNIREDEIQDIGLRFQIESMYTAETQYVRPDLEDYLETLKQEKIQTEKILTERCKYGEWT